MGFEEKSVRLCTYIILSRIKRKYSTEGTRRCSADVVNQRCMFLHVGVFHKISLSHVHIEPGALWTPKSLSSCLIIPICNPALALHQAQYELLCIIFM